MTSTINRAAPVVPRQSRIYFGWWTALAGGLLTLWGMGYNHYGLAALFKPIASDLGLSRTATSVAASISRFDSGFISPLAGWITDKFGPRRIITLGIFIAGLGLVMMYFADSLWSYILFWGVILGAGSGIAMGLPMDAGISNWFVKKRGTALSIKWIFAGFSGVAVLPLIAWLITVVGWRYTCVIGGVVMWVFGLPIAWFLFKDKRPEFYGLMPDGVKTGSYGSTDVVTEGVSYAAQVEETEFTVRQALRTRAFWLLISATIAASLADAAIAIHGIPFLTDIGIDPVKAAGMVAIMVLASMPPRFFGGVLADRMSKGHMRFLLASSFFLEGIGMAIFLLSTSIPSIYVWFILHGLGMGIGFSIRFPMMTRYFGRKAIGSISGVSALFTMPVGVAVPIYLGWIYDRFGSYSIAFTTVAISMIVATLITVFILPPKPPAKVTDVRSIL